MVGEIYRRFPVLCTVWAFMEVVLFGGVIFGWGSLVFILKEEGFYLEECTNEAVTSEASDSRVDVTAFVSNDTRVEFGYRVNVSDLWSAPEVQPIDLGCAAQESRLNLWFSIAVSIMYLSFTGIGYLIKGIGTRNTRLIFL